MISISHALSIIRESGESFQLSFVRSSGAKKGSIKKVKCLYGAPNPKTPGSTTGNGGAPGKGQQTFKRSSTIPLTDITDPNKRKLITPLISHFIEINGEKIKH